MDPFTQRMLEKAEQRSRALGISNTSKFPLSECNNSAGGGDAASLTTQLPKLPQQHQKREQQSASAAVRSPAQAVPSSLPSTNASTNTEPANKQLQVVEKKSREVETAPGGGVSPNKVMRQFSAVNKENMDLGIEINIMTDKDVEVEVNVENRETTNDGGDEHRQFLQLQEPSSQSLAKMRDTSRHHLQRLGALYSKPDDLSSPIHRTEAKFSAEDTDANAGAEKTPKRPKQRYVKLADLANSINQWEDDTTHHYATTTAAPVSSVPPPKPDLPSRRLAQQANKKNSPEPQQLNRAHATQSMEDSTIAVSARPAVAASDSGVGDNSQNKTKQLKWDPKVINSLEAQGFQRRESNTAKLAYEYENEEHTNDEDADENEWQEMKEAKDEKAPAAGLNKPVVGKLVASEIFNAEKKPSPTAEKKMMPPVKTGLVSGRAAVFEHKAAEALSQQQQRPQKDPTELPLKERMLLFEKNKGKALVPKAAFGMAPPIHKIRQEDTSAKKEPTKAHPSTASNSSVSTAATVKPLAESKVRDKVAALIANAGTISENRIKADIHKQRQEDMQVLANRFNKQKEAFAKEQQGEEQQRKDQLNLKHPAANSATGSTQKSSSRPPPPPPPPQPPVHNSGGSGGSLSSKRRSPGNLIDDETKRIRKNNTDDVDSAASARLYPMLSDLESDGSYNCGTTATPMHSECPTPNDDDAGAEDDNELEDGDATNCHDSYMDSEDDGSVGLGNNSLGRDVLQAVHKRDNQQNLLKHQQQQQQQDTANKHTKEVHYAKNDYYYGDSSLNSSEASMGVDDDLDEGLDEKNMDGDDDCTQESEEDEENTSRVSIGKCTTASNSFTFRKTPKRFSQCQTISEEHADCYTPATSSTNFTTTTSTATSQPITSELSVNREEDNTVTLVHTVSFYRKQQTANSNNSTPVRRICREQQVLRSSPSNGNPTFSPTRYESEQQQQQAEDSSDSESDSASDSEAFNESYLVEEKIKKLLDEVCKQQQVIAQTSQALNLCAATIEFSGSTESVEGERHLLVATHRRQSCLDEVQRLRIEKTLRSVGAPREKGRLTVKEITLPLRQDYIRKLAADTISGHHLVCLLKYNEHVLATKTVPTLPGLLAVKFPDVLQLNNVYADFRVTLEIYGMTAHREVLPHEVKYHINLNKKSGIKTPKKKGSDNRLVMPPVQSPAGPNVVRTPALVQYGFAIFSLRETHRTTWSLTQVLGVSPLEGTVHMKVNCELSVSVEHKGFLTMFEDISGFGAWHRRWCYLSGAMLNYWKYPDDEKKKAPLGSIDLYACITQKVTTAPRDICARLNTILLECQRPALETDRESLIIVPNGRTTTVRYLLSADTKEEREDWCAYFNKALTLLRAWGPPQ